MLYHCQSHDSYDQLLEIKREIKLPVSGAKQDEIMVDEKLVGSAQRHNKRSSSARVDSLTDISETAFIPYFQETAGNQVRLSRILQLYHELQQNLSRINWNF